jgi:hypothetical protein
MRWRRIRVSGRQPLLRLRQSLPQLRQQGIGVYRWGATAGELDASRLDEREEALQVCEILVAVGLWAWRACPAGCDGEPSCVRLAQCAGQTISRGHNGQVDAGMRRG